MAGPSRRSSMIPDFAGLRGAASVILGSVKTAANAAVETIMSSELVAGPAAFDQKAEKRHQDILREAKLQLNKPVGMLAIHIKEVEIIDLNPKDDFDRLDVTVYIRVQVGKVIKYTTAYDDVIAPTKIIFDSMKHFVVEVSPQPSHANNQIRVEFVAFDKDLPSQHHILAVKEIHIYDIIKRLCMVDSIDMYQMEKPVAIIDMEFGFAYGLFGYGYSSQLENRQKTPKEQLAHSVFHREDPPTHRAEGFRNIMTPRPVGHPPFINFTQKVDIGDTVKEFKSDMSVHDWRTIEEPILLVSRTKKRMHQLHCGYNEQPNRKSRLEFLRNLVHNNVPPSDVTKGEIDVPTGFRLRQRRHSRQTGLLREQDPDLGMPSSIDKADEEDLDVMNVVMQQAPGIIKRIRKATRRKEKTIEDPEKVEEPSTIPSQATPAPKGFFARLWGRIRGTPEVTPEVATRESVPSTGRIEEPPEAAPARRTTLGALKEEGGVDEDEQDELPSESLKDMREMQERMKKSSRFQQRRKSSMPHELNFDSRRSSFMTAAAVKLRQMVTKEEPDLDIPEITVMPATPEDSDAEDDSDF